MTVEPAWVGHLYLQPSGAPVAEDADAVTLHWDGTPLHPSALLTLRMLSPLAALPIAKRTEMRVLLAGEEIDWAHAACEAIGCSVTHHASTVNASEAPTFHRVLLVLAGKRPNWEELRPLIGQLRHEGQIGVIGVPSTDLFKLQRELTEHGFSLRAAGTNSDLGFLAGSIENPDQFKN
ncbi:MAG: hypothetical protein MK209_01835 [Planctomycetes bacterium]|nr:hypothetical protein [Planctomycetota bacterium]